MFTGVYAFAAVVLLSASAQQPSVLSPSTTFTVSPLDLGQIVAITPLGNLNPLGGHVLPTDHIYVDYGGKTNISVFAPGSGSVFAIREQIHGGAKIEVRVDKNVSYY